MSCLLLTHFLPGVTSYITISQYQIPEIDIGTIQSTELIQISSVLDALICVCVVQFYTVVSHVQICVTITTTNIKLPSSSSSGSLTLFPGSHTYPLPLQLLPLATTLLFSIAVILFQEFIYRIIQYLMFFKWKKQVTEIFVSSAK